jgi:hypothetical protein
MGFVAPLIYAVLEGDIAIVQAIHLDATRAKIEILVVFVGRNYRSVDGVKISVKTRALCIGNVGGLRKSAVLDVGQSCRKVQTIFVLKFCKERV